MLLKPGYFSTSLNGIMDGLSDHAKPSSHEAEFIRLFFPAAVEEEIASRWVRRLRTVVGPRFRQLRPETTLAEILEWAAKNNADSTDFLFVFEPELRMQFALFLEDAESANFREMVQHVASQYTPVGSN